MQVSKRLIVRKEIPLTNTWEMANSVDIAVAEYYCKNNNVERGLELFKKVLSQPINESERNNIIQKYQRYSLNYAMKLYSEKKYIEAIEIYREIMNYSGFPISIYKHIGICMKAIGNADLAIKFLESFEEISPDKEDVYIYLADLTYSDIKDYAKAIEYYEKALEKLKDNYAVYNMLGHLYSTYYQDKYKEKQIDYLKKAFELAPNNRIVVKNLAYVYGKFHETQKADEFYQKLMYLNPTHSDLHSYGAYLVQHKRFAEGFKFLQHRFQKEDLKSNGFPAFFNNKKKRWDIKQNISEKTILVHFEQGFGDSIMFVRFLKDLKTRCKKVLLVVQNGLIDLFKDSDLGIDIYSESDIPKLSYDYWIPMMDLPIVCETNPDNIPSPEGYLSVPKDKIKEYKKKHIENNDLIKIGFAYEGTMASKETNRDIPLSYLYPLFRMEGVELYSFQVDDISHQMDRVSPDIKFKKLGGTFKNWEDTACAMNCMDLIVTTDNGVMNLAGALGIKTFGIFNKIVEWRWFKTEGDDIAWYKSIKPFQTPTNGAWEVPVEAIVKEIEAIRDKKATKKVAKKTTKTKTKKKD